jgi:hypothetical protein
MSERTLPRVCGTRLEDPTLIDSGSILSWGRLESYTVPMLIGLYLGTGIEYTYRSMVTSGNVNIG